MTDIKIDKIIKSKRKTISIIIDGNAELIVRCPLNTSKEYIDKIVAKKSKWIKEKQELIKSRNKIYSKKEFIDGEIFMFLGKKYKLHVTNTVQNIDITDSNILLPKAYIDNAYSHIVQWYKNQAMQIILERVKHYSKELDIKYKSAKISSARTRWGSCSSNNTLNFTYRLIMAPICVIDYVIVHELIHILQHNHSKHFWDEVKKVMPDYQIHRNWLKDNQGIMRF